MKKVSTKLKAYFFAAAILIFAVILLETVALFKSYDYSANYFNSSLLVSIMRALIAVSAIAFFSSFIFIPKKELNGSSPLTLAALIPSGITAAVFAATGIIFWLAVLGNKAVLSFFTGLGVTYTVVLVIGGLFLLIGAAYFIINFVADKNVVKTVHPVFGFAVPVAVAIAIISGHFDISVSMNADAKITFQVAGVFFMLWFLTELRTLVGKPAPRAYFALGLTSSLLSASASVPFIIAFFAGIIKAPVFPTYIIYTVLALTMFAYTFTRTAVFVFARVAFERIAPPELETEIEEETGGNNEKV